MKKIKPFVIDWQIFPHEILVCFGGEISDAIKWVKKTGYKLSAEEIEILESPSQAGRTVMLNGGQTILWMRVKPKKGDPILAHEIFHATDFVTNRVGIKYSDDSDELWGYLIAYLTEKINEKL